MQIGKNTGNQVINVSAAAQRRKNERTGQNAKSENRKSIFAGDLTFNKDAVTLRKQRAQKKALKIVRDSWAGEKKIDQNVADIRAKVDDLKAEIAANQDIVDQGEARKEQLRQEYGVEADSQEQKDLELLEKKAAMMRGDDTGKLQLSEEEEARLNELQDPVTWVYKVPLTEYQQRCLDIDSEQGIYEARIATAEKQIQAQYASIRSIKLERLKSHNMVDAEKQADQIMEQASKETISMLMDEAKEHVDESYEEKREEAKEKAEEKEKQEEKIEDRREERAEQEARINEEKAGEYETEKRQREQEKRARDDAELMEDMTSAGTDAGGSADAVKTEIKEMLHRMKLLEEDLKGAEVDTELWSYVKI